MQPDSNIYIFSITAKVNGESRTGQFIGKRLSQRERSEVKVMAAQACGGMYPVIDSKGWTGRGIDVITYQDSVAWAHMDLAFAKPHGQKPPWFSQDTLLEDFADDDSVALKVWTEVQRQEESFRKTGRPAVAATSGGNGAPAGVPAAGGDDSGEEGRVGADARAGAATVAGGQVPAGLEP